MGTRGYGGRYNSGGRITANNRDTPQRGRPRKYSTQNNINVTLDKSFEPKVTTKVKHTPQKPLAPPQNPPKIVHTPQNLLISGQASQNLAGAVQTSNTARELSYDNNSSPSQPVILENLILNSDTSDPLDTSQTKDKMNSSAPPSDEGAHSQEQAQISDLASNMNSSQLSNSDKIGIREQSSDHLRQTVHNENSMDNLMLFFQQTLRATQEEFRREFDSLKITLRNEPKSQNQVDTATIPIVPSNSNQNSQIPIHNNPPLVFPSHLYSNIPRNTGAIPRVSNLNQGGPSALNNNTVFSSNPNININANTTQLGPSNPNVSINTESNIRLKEWNIIYDGTSPISDFIFKVETLWERSRCSEDHLLANFHVLLSGKVQDWFWLFTKQNRNARFSQLKMALTKEYGNLESDHDIILKISLRKQTQKESYNDFHSAITAMNARLSSPIPEGSLIDIMKKNVNDSLKFMMFNSQPRTLDDLRDMARKAEEVLRDSKSYPFHTSHRHISEIQIEADENSDSELNDPQVEALQFSKRFSKPDYSRIQCWNCSAFGHSYIYCSDRVRNVFCYKCGFKGVVTMDCPNKHQGNSKGSEVNTGTSRLNHQNMSPAKTSN